MSGEIVNLTALQEARAKMTPGVLDACCKDMPEDHPCRLVWRDLNEPAFSLTRDRDRSEGRVPKADVAGFVATHNAADVLIEAVKAALERDAAYRALDDAMVRRDASALEAAKVRLPAAVESYKTAISKVSL